MPAEAEADRNILLSQILLRNTSALDMKKYVKISAAVIRVQRFPISASALLLVSIFGQLHDFNVYFFLILNFCLGGSEHYAAFLVIQIQRLTNAPTASVCQ